MYKELKDLNESVADRQEYPAATLGIEPRNSHSTITKVSQYSEVGYQEKSSSPEWDEVIARLAAEIKVRHCSRKTLKTY